MLVKLLNQSFPEISFFSKYCDTLCIKKLCFWHVGMLCNFLCNLWLGFGRILSLPSDGGPFVVLDGILGNSTLLMLLFHAFFMPYINDLLGDFICNIAISEGDTILY